MTESPLSGLGSRADAVPQVRASGRSGKGEREGDGREVTPETW